MAAFFSAPSSLSVFSRNGEEADPIILAAGPLGTLLKI
jgi:hypothetical protein